MKDAKSDSLMEYIDTLISRGENPLDYTIHYSLGASIQITLDVMYDYFIYKRRGFTKVVSGGYKHGRETKG